MLNKKNILIPLSLIVLSSNVFSNEIDFWKRSDKFFDDMSKMMDQRFQKLNNSYNLHFSNNIKENKNNFQYEFDMPGIDKKDIKIYVNNHKLYVSGKKDVKENNNIQERNYSYVVSLSKNVNEKDIEAEYINGVLKVKVEKKEIKKLEDKRKYIEIK